MKYNFRQRLVAARAAKQAQGMAERKIDYKNNFVVTFELVPARASRGHALDSIIRFVQQAAKAGQIAAVSITDNAGGNPALSPFVLGSEIISLGMEPIIHFSCKDKNRNQIESHLFELDRQKIQNLLVMTGDYPRHGYMGMAKPVFDLDAVHLLDMVTALNQGMLVDPTEPNGGVLVAPTNFCAGCVVSPFKRTAAELIMQYQKFKNKIAKGASFVITQLGYDVRKFHELRLFMEQNSLNVPLLGTVFLPTTKLARLLHQGKIPGCIMPKRLLERMESAEKKGQDEELKMRLELGASLTALLFGIGYDGVHLSGPLLTYSHVDWILERARELASEWKELVKHFLFEEEWKFFYFQQDNTSGLNSKSINKPPKSDISFIEKTHFGLSKKVHHLTFSKNSPLAPVMINLAGMIDKSSLEPGFTAMEYFLKGIFYGCQECGDCTLGEHAFLCPQSQCPKYLLNGPCGGSIDGWCEVWPGKKKCIYIRGYERLNAVEEPINLPYLPPRNWSLYKSSSWLNYFLGRDNHSIGQKLPKAKD